jgi:hypothetical protein
MSLILFIWKITGRSFTEHKEKCHPIFRSILSVIATWVLLAVWRPLSKYLCYDFAVHATQTRRQIYHALLDALVRVPLLYAAPFYIGTLMNFVEPYCGDLGEFVNDLGHYEFHGNVNFQQENLVNYLTKFM